MIDNILPDTICYGFCYSALFSNIYRKINFIEFAYFCSYFYYEK